MMGTEITVTLAIVSGSFSTIQARNTSRAD
ncbi:hypothetical protein MB901379_02474 [Mycobacterium basiliense]|uniref:Uncharacterized protein n=1 Tax=Mycobacterium basiliense TaxID=2094119 RepID=A0A447GEM2_9MYCO|nr:hypothetical protein MB901379_02474 [Mycobacterium basiliense]